MRVIGWIGVLVTLLLSSSVRAQAPSPADAKALLEAPKGSISVGFTNAGRLIKPHELSAKGKGYQILPNVVPRRTNYGTDELIGLIERATAKVAERFPGSVLGVGNLGYSDGTKIPWSVSHQAGRDADLSFYATVQGRPYEKSGRALPLTYFAPNLLAQGQRGKGAPRFDVKRNLALVQALLEDPEGKRLQFLFVANWLRDAMIAEARQQRLPASLIARMGELMQQPSDSNSHNDHFHLRLFCSIEDRLHGCKNRGTLRSWVDLGDREVTQTARRLAQILQMQSPRHDALIQQALKRLGEMGASEQLQAIGSKLSATNPKVRRAALEALEDIGDARGAELILAQLPNVSDGTWALTLFAALPKLDPSKLISVAERVVVRPQSVLHAKALARAEGPVLVTALQILRDHGQKSSVSAVASHLDAKDRKVKRAATEALEALTCRPVQNTKRFQAFWVKNQHKSLSSLAEDGLLAQRLVRVKSLRSKAGVEGLIRLLDRRSIPQQVCANRALERITGRDFDRTLRTPARNKRNWQHWWRNNSGRFGWR